MFYCCEVSMRKKKIIYSCTKCNKTIKESAEKIPTPQCCGIPMKKNEAIGPCQSTVTAEHERFYDSDTPCDDGTAG